MMEKGGSRVPLLQMLKPWEGPHALKLPGKNAAENRLKIYLCKDDSEENHLD